ncbi:MAG: hypothetical protein LBM75_07250 [Myxococcales bacterium]|nr:hypothetical protein [Myxococcales bacterium]
MTESMEWRDVATKEALPMVEAPSAPPEPLPVPAEQEDDDLDERDPFDGMSQREIREIKADSYADLAEQAILVVGGMFDAPEKKLALKPRERKALRKAILPVIPEDTGADPWGSLVILGIMLLAPRAAVIYTAREEQIAKAQAESLLTGQNALETAECHAAA